MNDERCGEVSDPGGFRFARSGVGREVAAKGGIGEKKMASTTCLSCNRALTLERSVRGLGAICAAKAQSLADANGDRIDIPFDPVTMDIICRRDEAGTHFNIYQVYQHHSPTGMEWGYPGSGPADFALNIVALFCRELYPGEKLKIRLWDGQKVTLRVWDLYQCFKRSSIGSLPREGGTIKGDNIRNWIFLQTGDPIVAEPDPTGNLVISREKGLYRAATTEEKELAAREGKNLYISHFATCPDAKNFRRKGA